LLFILVITFNSLLYFGKSGRKDTTFFPNSTIKAEKIAVFAANLSVFGLKRDKKRGKIGT